MLSVLCRKWQKPLVAATTFKSGELQTGCKPARARELQPKQ